MKATLNEMLQVGIHISDDTIWDIYSHAQPYDEEVELINVLEQGKDFFNTVPMVAGLMPQGLKKQYLAWVLERILKYNQLAPILEQTVKDTRIAILCNDPHSEEMHAYFTRYLQTLNTHEMQYWDTIVVQTARNLVTNCLQAWMFGKSNWWMVLIEHQKLEYWAANIYRECRQEYASTQACDHAIELRHRTKLRELLTKETVHA